MSKRDQLEFVVRFELDEHDQTTVLNLCSQIFGGSRINQTARKLKQLSQPVLILVYDNQKVVGFKLGFAQDEEIFYSWIGGVLQNYRSVGLGSAMMNKQHQILRAKGYRKVRTKSENRFKRMLMLNLKFGFDITGLEEEKIVMEKKL